MKMKVQLVFEESGEEIKKDVMLIEKGEISASTIGLSLAESKQITAKIQQVLVEQQLEKSIGSMQKSQLCSKNRVIKSYHKIVYRTLFGKLSLKSPRLKYCECEEKANGSFSPLTTILSERTSPELIYEQAKLASLMSYGVSAKLLNDYFPVSINVKSVYMNTHKVSAKIEADLKDEKFSFIHEVKRIKEKFLNLACHYLLGLMVDMFTLERETIGKLGGLR